MGPTWVLSAPDEPHVGPMYLAIRDLNVQRMFHCWFVCLSGCRAEMSQYTGYIRTSNVRYPPDTSPDYSHLISCEWIIKTDGKLVTFETVPGITNAIDTTAGTNDRYKVSDTHFHILFQSLWATYSGLGKPSAVSTHGGLLTHIYVIGLSHHFFRYWPAVYSLLSLSSKQWAFSGLNVSTISA